MNMYNSEQEQKFLALRVQGKSLKTIAKELNVPIDTVLEWDFELSDDIYDAKKLEYDKIVEERDLAGVSRFKYLAELYERLKKELDKRDFSGLPTDKLYIILNDVYERIQKHHSNTDENDWYDEDNFDSLDDNFDFPES